MTSKKLTGTALLEDNARIAKMNAARERAAKTASKSAPEVKPTPVKAKPPTGKIPDAIKVAGFRFVKTVEVDGALAHGYERRDGAAALYTVTGETESWTIKAHDGLTMTSESEKGSLKYALLATSKSSRNRAAHQAKVNASTAAKKLATVQKLVEQAAPAAELPLAHVLSSIKLLEKFSKMFDLNVLRGDDAYTQRVQLLKLLLQTDKVLAKESGVNRVIDAFYTALSIPEGTLAAKAKAFAAKCKEITAAVRTAKAASAKLEAIRIEDAKRATVLERTVKGVILPGSKPLNKYEQKKLDDEVRREVHAIAQAAATCPEKPVKAVKKSADPLAHLYDDCGTLATVQGDEERTVHTKELPRYCADDILLLENTANGLVLLRLERPNSQGAVCVYNNGGRVACGLVSTETLQHFRKIEDADIIAATNQLLNPMMTGIEVTTVARRHLTAVLHCKELIAMATKKVVETEERPRKFAAPAKSTKTMKAAPKAAPKAVKSDVPTEKPAKAVSKAEKVVSHVDARKASRFRLVAASKSTWSNFTKQKGDIVAGLAALGAVGSKASGVTGTELCAQLPGIAEKNVRFYLSVWQHDNIIEKLA